jgi:hypothetical protein
MYETVYYTTYGQHITSFLPESKTGRRRAIREGRTLKENTPAYALFLLIVSFFAVLFFTLCNVALSHATTQIFLGSPAQIRSSLWHSLKRLPTLLMWTISALIVHMACNLLKGKNKNGRRSFLLSLVGEALEFAWAIATFLIVPVFAHEKLGTFKSIRRSAGLMKKTFGENIASSMMFGLVSFAIIASWALLLLGAITAIKYVESLLEIRLLAVGLSLIIGVSLIAAFLGLIVSAATTVFKTAIYHYAVGSLIGPFSQHELQTSFEKEEKQ